MQVRTAHVLGQGALLAPLFKPFSLGLGAWFGTGKAWFPWIHIDDICSIYLFAIENPELNGPVNAGANEVVRQKDFMKTFGRSLGRPVFLSLPIPFVYLRYLSLAHTFNNSVKMSSAKLIQRGFRFKYPKLRECIDSIVHGDKP